LPQPQPTRPNYADAFQCIGPACEDTCSQGWQISIDQPAFDRLQTLPASPLQTLVETSIQPNSPNGQFVQIQMRPDRTCPFLTPEKLCQIQSTAGEEYMPLGCTLYPRILHRIDNVLEKSLSLSCPEAARLVLLNPTILRDATRNHREAFESLLAQIAIDTPNPTDPRPYFWPIRELQLAIVLNRRHSIDSRVSQLGALARQLDKAIRTKRPIAAILRSFADTPPADEIGLNTNIDFVLKAIDLCLSPAFRNPRLATSAAEFLHGIRFTPTTSITILASHFQHAAASHYQSFLNQHPHILENYLCNFLFRNLFPFGWAPTTHSGFELEYQKLAAHFTLLEGLLIGIAGHYRQQMNTAPVIQAIQSLTRSVEHSRRLPVELTALHQRLQPPNQPAVAPEQMQQAPA
jgi:lysine-N-methylase